ncbi:zinc-dependent alcohol dehydrogenase [Flexithrix dorotheae]|uniref:zinc-dependent alcohol dehydrogenase n=1 Tax=Flexithrix dorotheae TaxID=70993 RepID=UPI0003777F50|nr:zinc-binding alcohol dehydrogenase [Flexithrix dorotheae]
MQIIKALWHNINQSWLEESKLLHDEGEVLIESKYSLISLGTEKTIITQLLDSKLAGKMKVPYMLGDFQEDFTYGYSLVGKVIEGPDQLKNKFVHLMHPHQDLVSVKPSDVFPIPGDIALQTACLASNMETAVNAIWDADVEIGDNILVFGFGTIGALTALVAKNIPGVELTVIETDEGRRNLAKQLGFQVLSDIDEGNFEVVFNTTGQQKVLQKALELTRQEGKVIEMSWYGTREIQISLGTDFHYGRKQIISSQVSQIPKRKLGQWDYSSRKHLVFKLLKALKPDFLIDSEIPFSQSPDFFHQLRMGKIKGTGIVIKY